MKDVYVIEAMRTPFGSFGGMFSDIEAPKLAATVMQGILKKTGLSPDAINEVVLGQVLMGGCGQAPARQAMRSAGISDSAHAMTINKVCGSGLKAIMLGSDSIKLGNAGMVFAGGMENMSMTPYLIKKARYGYRMGHGELIDLLLNDGLLDPGTGRHMGEIGELGVESNGLSREDQDNFALRSYRLAQVAVKEGIFRDEIIPVVKSGKGGDVILSDDEEPFKVDFDRIAKLRPVFKKDGTITAGNASTINDGAAIALLTDDDGLKRHNLTPQARIVSISTESRHPDQFPEAPVGAIEKACAKVGIKPSDIDLFEINEAFASVPLISIKQLKLDPDKVNVNGGACSIGHPIGASGARLAGTVIRELQRRKARYGLSTLCIGGGEAVAVIFERV